MTGGNERSLTVQIVAVIPVLILGILIVSLLLFQISGRRVVATRVEDSIRPVAESLSYSVTPLISTDRFSETQRLIDQLSASRTISRITVYDGDGGIIASTLDEDPILSPEEVEPFLAAGKTFGGTISRDDMPYALYQPVFGREYDVTNRTNIAAVVLIEPRFSSFWVDYRHIAAEAIAVLALAVIAGVGLLYTNIRRQVLNPLRRISEAANNDRESELRMIAASPSSREFGELVGAILRMMQDIAAKNRDLQIHAESLEHAVSERTEQLESSLRELKSARDAMVQQEKMASVGQLSAGIAHEINNPAGYLRSNLTSLSEYNDILVSVSKEAERLAQLVQQRDDAEAQTLARRIIERATRDDVEFVREDSVDLVRSSLTGIRRITEIIQGLQRFSRREAPDQHESVSVSEAVQEALTLAKNELKYHYRIDLDLDDCRPVTGVHGQLTQVFINILMNAKQAMPNGGDITIRSRCDDRSVSVMITDTGSGIEPKNLDRIFDPFFTTKPVGSGTGLGLSIVHGIIESFGGSITATSEVNVGTTFTIALPVYVPEKEEAYV